VLGLGAIAAPWIVALLLAALRPPLDKSWRAYYARWQDAATSAQQVALAITFLPHQAWISADAIVRTSGAARSSAGATCSSGRPPRRSTPCRALGARRGGDVAGRGDRRRRSRCWSPGSAGAPSRALAARARGRGPLLVLWLVSPGHRPRAQRARRAARGGSPPGSAERGDALRASCTGASSTAS
jgi:hypothetical protein